MDLIQSCITNFLDTSLLYSFQKGKSSRILLLTQDTQERFNKRIYTKQGYYYQDEQSMIISKIGSTLDFGIISLIPRLGVPPRY